jgi:hypothetical protein
VLRSDQGTEFVNESLRSFCKQKGISLEVTSTYSPHQNGTAERMNRTLLDMVRTMLISSKFPLELWGDLHHHAVYLYNRRPHSSLKEGTPAELFLPKGDSRVALEMKWLYPIGATVFATVTAPKKRARKLEPRAQKGYYLGKARNELGVQYWDYVTKTVHASSMVTVDATQRFKPEGESSSIPLSAQHGEEFSVDCILDEKA